MFKKKVTHNSITTDGGIHINSTMMDINYLHRGRLRSRAGKMAQSKQQATHPLLTGAKEVNQTVEYYSATKKE